MPSRALATSHTRPHGSPMARGATAVLALNAAGTPRGPRGRNAPLFDAPRPNAGSVPNGDRRLAGWSIIEKITPFVHAVGRLSDGSGSAILVSLPDRTEHAEAAAAQARNAHTESAAALRRRRRERMWESGLSVGSAAARGGISASSGLNLFGAAPAAAGVSWSATHNTSAAAAAERDPQSAAVPSAPLAVLLTSSAVLPSREAAAGLSVVFMEQTVAGTAAQLGREPLPCTVAICASAGFVCSVGPRAAPAWLRPGSGEQVDWGADKGPARPPAAARAEWGGDGDDAEGPPEEIGYTLTYCEVTPAATNPAGAAAAEHRQTSSRVTEQSWTGASGIGGGGDWSFRSGAAASRRRVPAESIAPVAPLKGDRRDDNLFLVKPLPLPLLLSAIPPVKVGDTHLMVTHVDGGHRSYVVQYVAAVHADFCEYRDDATLEGDASSGGPAFNLQGDFIGLQHRVAEQSVCMFTSSIVRSLFRANKLGMCQSPISGQPPPDATAFGPHPLAAADDQAPEEAFNQPFSFTQMSAGVTDVGAEGGRLIEFADLEWLRTFQERPVPMPQRRPSYVEVYAEFYSDFASLTHMLNAFSYCPALITKVLEAMVSAQYRQELQSVATSGGVGMVLEVMDGYPASEPLVNMCLSALSRMCLHRHNLAAFVRVDGVATVIEILKEYPHSPTILQWGAFCIAHATGPEAPAVWETIDVMLQCSTVELAVSALRAHGRAEAHLTRYLCVALANVARALPRAVTLFLHEALPQVMIDLMTHYGRPATGNLGALTGLVTLLQSMLVPLKDELPEDFFLPAGGGGPREVTTARERCEELPPFVSTSPLSVSAYFMYATFAAQPVVQPEEKREVEGVAAATEEEAGGEGHPTEEPSFPDSDGAVPSPALAPPPAPPSNPIAGKARPPAPPDIAPAPAATGEAANRKRLAWAVEALEAVGAAAAAAAAPPAAGTGAESSAPSLPFVAQAAASPAVPRTPLNCLLLFVLDRESRERLNRASFELLSECLDILLVLSAWGLFPVDFSPSEAAERSHFHTHDEGGRGGEYGFAASTPAEVLTRIEANYFSSVDVSSRIKQFGG